MMLSSVKFSSRIRSTSDSQNFVVFERVQKEQLQIENLLKFLGHPTFSQRDTPLDSGHPIF